MQKPKLTASRLREVLHYDPSTGQFHWHRQCGLGRNQTCDKRAGHRHDKGYVCIKVDGKLYKAHRLAWLYVTGEWPSEQIDHRDTVRDNNRFSNLREATPAQNSQNQIKASRNNKCGLLGVSWDKKQRKWAATLCINGKNKRLGRYQDPQSAHAAYLAAKAIHHAFASIARANQ